MECVECVATCKAVQAIVYYKPLKKHEILDVLPYTKGSVRIGADYEIEKIEELLKII